MISRDNSDIEGELYQEYGLFQESTSEVGDTHSQAKDDQVANQNISSSGSVTET